MLYAVSKVCYVCTLSVHFPIPCPRLPPARYRNATRIAGVCRYPQPVRAPERVPRHRRCSGRSGSAHHPQERRHEPRVPGRLVLVPQPAQVRGSVCVSVGLPVLGPSTCLSVCRLVGPSVCRCMCRLVSRSVYWSVGLSVYWSVCLSVLYVCMCVCLRVGRSVRRSVLSIHPSVHVSVCLSACVDISVGRSVSALCVRESVGWLIES